MIIHQNDSFEIRSGFPDTDWTGEAKFVIPDGSDLAKKIMFANDYRLITDDEGHLIDVEEIEPEITPMDNIELELTNLSLSDKPLIEELEKIVPMLAEKVGVELSPQLVDILEERAEHRAVIIEQENILKGKELSMNESANSVSK